MDLSTTKALTHLEMVPTNKCNNKANQMQMESYML